MVTRTVINMIWSLPPDDRVKVIWNVRSVIWVMVDVI